MITLSVKLTSFLTGKWALLLLCCLTVNLACGPSLDEDAKRLAMAEEALDLPALIDELASEWTQEKLKLEKTVTGEDGTPETQVIDQPNWKEELASFSQNDIKKIAIFEKYDFQKNQSEEQYLATDSSLKVRSVYLLPNEKNWQVMKIRRLAGNPLYDSDLQLELDKSKRRAFLKANRKMLFIDPSEITIEWKAF